VETSDEASEESGTQADITNETFEGVEANVASGDSTAETDSVENDNAGNDSIEGSDSVTASEEVAEVSEDDTAEVNK
jgi:hypothetical protein